MRRSEIWKLCIWSSFSLIWKWCLMENTITGEEPTPALSHSLTLWEVRLCARLVISSSSQPHLPDCGPVRVSPASLPLCPREAPSQQSWAQLGPSFCLPIVYFPVWTSPWATPETLPAESQCAGLDGTVDGGHPGCVLSFSELHPCLWPSPLGWWYSQGERTTVSLASLESPYSLGGNSLSCVIIQPFTSLGQGSKHFANCSWGRGPAFFIDLSNALHREPAVCQA